MRALPSMRFSADCQVENTTSVIDAAVHVETTCGRLHYVGDTRPLERVVWRTALRKYTPRATARVVQ